MADRDPILDDDEDIQRRDPDDPGEVPTTFATVGRGWSGRDDEEDDEDEA